MDSKSNTFRILFFLFLFIALFLKKPDKKNEKGNQEQSKEKGRKSSNELKIELFPENKKRNDLLKEPLSFLIDKDTSNYSFDLNRKLAFINSNVPLLTGFYNAHINHLPIRIRPDDIWLLIVQAFSNHVNSDSEKLRKYFVNFEGKKKLEIVYAIHDCDILHLPKKYYEDFPEKINNLMEQYLGKEILDNLTPDFSTTDYDSMIISKLSIMGSFKKYFEYIFTRIICGNPYIILEGTEDDYRKILSKAQKLRKYDFEWYIDRIIPHIEKMIEAKKGNIDIEYFQNIIQEKEELTNHSVGCATVFGKENFISGWILNFFSHFILDVPSFYDKTYVRFTENSISINNIKDLAGQMLNVPFKLKDEETGKEYDMEYKVGFIGCDQNEKDEVYPVQGWIVSPVTKKEELKERF